MKRGDIVTVSAGGAYGKPRPAIVIQSEHLTQAGLQNVILCLITNHLEEAPTFRLDLPPDDRNGLTAASQIMTDKILTVRREKIGRRIGRLGEDALRRLDRTLTFVIGLAD